MSRYPADLIVRPYLVLVDGFYDGSPCVAGSPGKARAAFWRDYNCAYDCSFKRFLQISRVIRLEPAPHLFGLPITVCGAPAYRTGMQGQYVQFVRPGGDVLLLSHPADVKERAT